MATRKPLVSIGGRTKMLPAGDTVSIAGIDGSKALFNTALTDGDFLYVGDISQYTDELAQDAIGAMLDPTLEYLDGTPLLRRAALTGAITAAAGSNTTALGSFTIAQLNTAVSDTDVVAATAVNLPATDAATAYPNNSVSTGSMISGGPMGGGIGTHLTVESNTDNRVAQFAFSAAGGTSVPDVWLRTSHGSVGGGGWTSFYKMMHYATFEPYSVVIATSGYTETAAYGEKIILCNLAAGFTVVLPSAVTSKAKLTFKKIDAAGVIVLDGASTQTIDGSLTISLTAQYESVTLVSDGANWMII